MSPAIINHKKIENNKKTIRKAKKINYQMAFVLNNTLKTENEY